jgi:hypothetical protein
MRSAWPRQVEHTHVEIEDAARVQALVVLADVGLRCSAVQPHQAHQASLAIRVRQQPLAAGGAGASPGLQQARVDGALMAQFPGALAQPAVQMRPLVAHDQHGFVETENLEWGAGHGRLPFRWASIIEMSSGSRLRRWLPIETHVMAFLEAEGQ